MGGNSRITMAIESRLADVGLVGVAVRAIALAAGFADHDAGLLQLALEEALTNVIRHAYQERPGNQVTVEITVSPDQLTFLVSHQGAGLQFWPTKTSHSPDPMQEGGRGIFLINSIMDSVNHANRAGQSRLTMTKRRGTP